MRWVVLSGSDGTDHLCAIHALGGAVGQTYTIPLHSGDGPQNVFRTFLSQWTVQRGLSRGVLFPVDIQMLNNSEYTDGLLLFASPRRP